MLSTDIALTTESTATCVVGVIMYPDNTTTLLLVLSLCAP